MWSALRSTVADANYHLGKRLTGVADEGHQVTATFADGTSVSADMLIGADGGSSTVRDLVFPSVGPEYAGYVAFRGLVPEAMLAPAPEALYETFAFYQEPGSHILSYMVADEQGNVDEGRRRYNWVWYRNADESLALPQNLRDRDGRHGSMGVALSIGVSTDCDVDPNADELRCVSRMIEPGCDKTYSAGTVSKRIEHHRRCAAPRLQCERSCWCGEGALRSDPPCAASVPRRTQPIHGLHGLRLSDRRKRGTDRPARPSSGTCKSTHPSLSAASSRMTPLR
jgi:hypothetical protein